MTLRRLTRQVLMAVGAAIGAGSAVGAASGQPPPLVLAGPVAQEATAQVGNLVLVGVIVAGDRSFAMFSDRTAGAGASEMVRVGGSVGGHRLVDIQLDRVTVETPGGQRVTVRLAAGSGQGQITPPSEKKPNVVTPTPPSRRSERRRERARVAAERAAAGLPVDPAADVME